MKKIFSKLLKKDKEFNKSTNFFTEKDIRDLQKENIELKNNFTQKVIEKFKTRRSIRKFSDKQVDWEIIYSIIEAGLNGPVAGNIQNYKIIAITDPNERKELGKAAFQQYWLSDAPVILVIVRDNYRLMQLYPQEGEIYSIQNTAALIENILMGVHFYDLGACWVEAYENQVIKEFLNVPVELEIDAIIPIGYPLESPKVSKEVESSLIFYNKYGNKKRFD